MTAAIRDGSPSASPNLDHEIEPVDTMEGAWNEGWVGRQFKIDKCEVSDKTLIMTSAPFNANMDGAEIVVTTTYERVE